VPAPRGFVQIAERERTPGQPNFLLDALRFGAPPHGGIAIGMDRLSMLFSGAGGLRDVIPFAKTQPGTDLMTDAPNRASPEQLAELRVRTIEPES
jgi:aspartyl-tRNA synthetase